MLSDYELIVHKFPDRQDIRIYPISDVHLGAAEHLEREWNLFTAHLLDDPHA
jgi:DNA polymerase II small subunit/DNA polymerase delta subunit B